MKAHFHGHQRRKVLLHQLSNPQHLLQEHHRNRGVVLYYQGQGGRIRTSLGREFRLGLDFRDELLLLRGKQGTLQSF